MPQRSIRFSEKLMRELKSTAATRGFASPAAFIRYAVEQELGVRQEDLTGTEERLAARMEQLRKEVFRLGRTHQALFAYLDTLAKALLTCLPEPGGEAMEAAVARAQGRHARLLKAAGQAMVGDSQVAMEDLVSNEQG